MPETVGFQTKPEIALEQIKSACAAGLPRGVVLMDAGYGNDTELRTATTALDLSYVAGIGGNTAAWPPGKSPLPPLPGSGRGRPPKLLRRDDEHHPLRAKALAHDLPPEAWQEIAWREGSADWLCSRFARVRMRPSHRDTWRAEPHPEEWLLIEWPQGEAEPTKYWFSTLPEDISFDRLVDLAKLRWRIERDYQELKQELGLGDYEGRGVARLPPPLCIAAYGFLIAERGALPPSGPASAALLPGSILPLDYRPRGAANPPRAARAELDCQHSPPPDPRARQDATEMPLLQLADPEAQQNPPDS